MWSVLAPETFHTDWEAWDRYLDLYEHGTKQMISCVETRPVQSRIKAIKDTVAWKRGDRVPLPPLAFETWQKRFACTHGGSQRDGRGTDRRPHRFVRYTGCPFKFTVEVVPVKAPDRRTTDQWHLQVRLGVYEHNHPVDEETYKTYPSERGVASIANSASVDTMISVHTKRSEIYDYLLKNGENLIKRDVDNLVAKHRSKVTTTDDNDSAAALIADFLTEDPFNMATIDATHRGHTGVISISTALMRATYARFPELILVDCTHKTNRYNYHLCTFMVVDEHGAGQPVQHSLLETNSDWHMLCAIAHFVRANPTCTTELKVMMADKDLNEIRVFRSEFPMVNVLLCTFHVKKYLASASRKSEHGRLSSEDHLAIDHHVHYCMYAANASEYAEQRDSLKKFCERVGFHSFYSYFEKNWDSCQPMWVEHYRHKLPHFKVNTNNHLASFFGKVKDRVSPEISMTECLEQLLAKERTRASEHRYLTKRVGTNVNANFHDRELQTVLRFTTHFVADNIAKEYAKAKLKAASYSYTEDTGAGTIEVTGAAHTHTLDTSTWACSCAFAVTMKLPCRHAVAFRLTNGVLPLIPLEAIHIRWNRVVENIPRAAPFVYNDSTPSEAVQHSAPMTRQERFREAMRVLQPLCSEIAEISDEEEFQAAIDFVTSQWMNVRRRMRLPVSDRGDGDGRQHDFEPEESSSHDDERATQVTDMPLSQAHSLYSEEIGSVQIVSAHEVSLPEPEPMTLSSQASQEVSFEGTTLRVRRSLALRSLPEDDTDEASPPPTLTTSYYDNPTPPRDLVARMNFNQRVSAVGRHPIDRAAVASAVKQDRVRFGAVQQARRENGEVTLRQLLDTLDRAKPTLADLNKQLLSERHRDLLGCRPQYFKQRAPDTVADVFYHLPDALLKKCFEVMPLANDFEDAISIASSSQATEGSQAEDQEVEVIKIRKLLFTRKDIETMARASQLKDAAEFNLQMVRWLRVTVAARVPADLQHSVKRVADHVASMYPLRALKGYREDFHYGMLWRFEPPAWFNDGIIRAFLERLASQHSHFRGTNVQRTTWATSMQYERELSARVRDDVLRCLADPSVSLFALPVCFGGGNGSHWTCIVIDKSTSSAIIYDSMNAGSTHNTMRLFVNYIFSLCKAVNPPVHIHDTPAQFDSHSCGFYVCMKLWCLVDDAIRREYPELGDLVFRFKLLDFLLDGVNGTHM